MNSDRRDLALILGGCLAALAALLAVAWRATPDQTDVAVVLFAASGAFETAGLAALAYDLYRQRRRTRVYVAPGWPADAPAEELVATSSGHGLALIGFAALVIGVLAGAAAGILTATR